MSVLIRIIGIIIIIIGLIGVITTIYTTNSEVWELNTAELLSTDRFLKNMTMYIGQVIIIGIGFAVYFIGIKLCQRSARF